MGIHLFITEANTSMYFHEKDIVEQYSQFLVLYKRFIDDIVAIWCGPRDTLLEFLDAHNNKNDRIKLTHCISDSSISFLDLCLF